MTRSVFDTGPGLPLARSPSRREQTQRRRLMALAVATGLALASGFIGMASAPRGPAPGSTGPFSYFPSE